MWGMLSWIILQPHLGMWPRESRLLILEARGCLKWVLTREMPSKCWAFKKELSYQLCCKKITICNTNGTFSYRITACTGVSVPGYTANITNLPYAIGNPFS